MSHVLSVHYLNLKLHSFPSTGRPEKEENFVSTPRFKNLTTGHDSEPASSVSHLVLSVVAFGLFSLHSHITNPT